MHFLVMLSKISYIIMIKNSKKICFYIWSKKLFLSLNVVLKLTKTTSPQKIYSCMSGCLIKIIVILGYYTVTYYCKIINVDNPTKNGVFKIDYLFIFD